MGKICRPQRSSAARALLPGNLARDFAPKAKVACNGVRAFNEAILAAEHPVALAAFGQWKTLFGKTCGYDLQRPSAKIEQLAQCYGITTAGQEPDAVLFALHTYYAVLVKLLVGQVMARSQGLPAPAAKLLQADAGDQFRSEVEDLQNGGILRELNVGGVFRGDLFSWYTARWSVPVERTIRQLAARLAEYDPETLSENAAGGVDLLGPLYQALFPRSLRHHLGEYYTPDWLVDHVVEIVGYSGEPEQRLLDPACGAGTFLVTAINRIRARWEAGWDERELCHRILGNVVGFDLNPLAVLAARANYLIAIRDLLPYAGRVKIPVYLRDSILDGAESAGRFDYLVGNPPWIAWDNLPKDYRQATKPLWERYGLFSLSGNEGRHGGGKKDLSMLMVYTSADRHLRQGGRLAMVITQTLFQTKGAGDGFRHFRLGPEGDWLKVLRVDDMVKLRPFQDAANFTSVIAMEKGAPTQYPVPYVIWSPGDSKCGDNFAKRMYRAEPIESSRPGAPWFLRPGGFDAELPRLIGPAEYVAHLGANSGGANGVYWVEILGEAKGGVRVRNIAGKNKRDIEVIERVVEPDLLYPLVRWADVTRYRALPSAHILLAQDVAARTGIDEAVMQGEYPRTYAYLKRFERVLGSRAAYQRYQGGRAFYSMYNVGSYTVAPIKVVWRRMDRRINAAVVEEAEDPVLGPRPAVPQETCVLIALESPTEAHYVCAALNSSIVNFLVTAHSVRGGKGFGTPGMLDFVKLRRFNPDDPRHEELAACSRQAQSAVAAGDASHGIQRRIDQLSGELWGLRKSELEAIASS